MCSVHHTSCMRVYALRMVILLHIICDVMRMSAKHYQLVTVHTETLVLCDSCLLGETKLCTVCRIQVAVCHGKQAPRCLLCS